MGDETAFRVYDHPLSTVTSFCYLGQILTVTDNDGPEVFGNLRKARQIWA